MVTIFTPTYNRSALLNRLYKSLLTQTSKSFEWLIVDDGSTDDTESVVNELAASGHFPIKYIKKANGGKHSAINVGVQNAGGELFFIVDSDDSLTADAVQWIEEEFEKVRGNDEIAGIVGQKISPDGRVNGQESNDGTMDVDALTLRYKFNGTGDHAEVFRTSILKQYPFPEVEGERFVAESLVWNRIALKYKMRYIAHPIYIFEYLPDGLTNNILRHWIGSPHLSMAASLQTASLGMVPLKERFKAISNYWRYYFFSHTSFVECVKRAGIGSVVFLPIGYCLYLRSRNLK